MSRAELDLVAQSAQASGFNPYDILYGSPSNRSSPPLEPRTSTPAGSGLSQDFCLKLNFHLPFHQLLHLRLERDGNLHRC